MEKHLKTAEFIARALDNAFSLGPFHFGLAFLIDLIPELGDVIDLLMSTYLIWIALNLRLPKIKIMHMIYNIGVNFLIGLVPVLGDTIYLYRKANLKNLQIIKSYLQKSPAI